MAKFIDIDEGEILDLDADAKYYINTVLRPLLEQNLMEKARKKIMEDGEWDVQVFLLTALGEDQYFFNSNKILDEEFKNYDLVSFTIPSTITTIGRGAFAGNSLKSIEIPDSVIKIGDGAFWGMTMTKIQIPRRFRNIMEDLFNTRCLRNANIIYTE